MWNPSISAIDLVMVNFRAEHFHFMWMRFVKILSTCFYCILLRKFLVQIYRKNRQHFPTMWIYSNWCTNCRDSLWREYGNCLKFLCSKMVGNYWSINVANTMVASCFFFFVFFWDATRTLWQLLAVVSPNVHTKHSLSCKMAYFFYVFFLFCIYLHCIHYMFVCTVNIFRLSEVLLGCYLSKFTALMIVSALYAMTWLLTS